MLLATVRWIVNLVTWDYVAIFVKVDLIEKCRGLERTSGSEIFILRGRNKVRPLALSKFLTFILDI